MKNVYKFFLEGGRWVLKRGTLIRFEGEEIVVSRNAAGGLTAEVQWLGSGWRESPKAARKQELAIFDSRTSTERHIFARNLTAAISAHEKEQTPA